MIQVILEYFLKEAYFEQAYDADVIVKCYAALKMIFELKRNVLRSHDAVTLIRVQLHFR